MAFPLYYIQLAGKEKSNDPTAKLSLMSWKKIE